jgi:uncharacterized protein (DUF2147 family)
MRTNLFVMAAACAVIFASGANAQEAPGTYKRPNGDLVRVSVSGGKLFCQIVQGQQTGFEMCHGMSKGGPNAWQGAEMKHPSMPAFMTFNGTVTVAATGLSIKGCAVGQSMCDTETWSRQK